MPSNLASLHQLFYAFLACNKFRKVSSGTLGKICLSVPAGLCRLFAAVSAAPQLFSPPTSRTPSFAGHLRWDFSEIGGGSCPLFRALTLMLGSWTPAWSSMEGVSISSHPQDDRSQGQNTPTEPTVSSSKLSATRQIFKEPPNETHPPIHSSPRHLHHSSEIPHLPSHLRKMLQGAPLLLLPPPAPTYFNSFSNA